MRKVVVAVMLLAACIILFVTFGCGDKTPPNVPTIVATTDKDIRASQMKVYGILQAAGQVLNEASKLEDQLTKSVPTSIPPGSALDQQLRTAFRRVAQDALSVIDSLEKNTIPTWEQVKVRVQPIIDEIVALQAIVTPGGHPKLVALIDALAQIAVGVLAPQLLGGR